MSTRNQLPGTSNHNLWHHLAMVVISEVINFIWLFGAGIVVLGGFALFNFTGSAFFKVALGLPMILSGCGVVLFKIHEIILVLFRPQRIKVMCRFCKES